jgi:hypothetical protein
MLPHDKNQGVVDIHNSMTESQNNYG